MGDGRRQPQELQRKRRGRRDHRELAEHALAGLRHPRGERVGRQREQVTRQAHRAPTTRSRFGDPAAAATRARRRRRETTAAQGRDARARIRNWRRCPSGRTTCGSATMPAARRTHELRPSAPTTRRPANARPSASVSVPSVAEPGERRERDPVDELDARHVNRAAAEPRAARAPRRSTRARARQARMPRNRASPRYRRRRASIRSPRCARTAAPAMRRSLQERRAARADRVDTRVPGVGIGGRQRLLPIEQRNGQAAARERRGERQADETGTRDDHVVARRAHASASLQRFNLRRLTLRPRAIAQRRPLRACASRAALMRPDSR